MPKPAARVTPAKPPPAPGCDQCRPYADALGVTTGIAEWLLENAKRGMVPDIFTIGMMADRLRDALAGVRRGANGAANGRAGR